MDRIREINSRQLTWLVSVMITAGGLMSLPKSLIEVASLDAWVSEIGGVLYGGMIAFVLYQLAMRFPGKNLFEIARELWGPVIGGLINGLMLLYLWTILLRDARVFTDFIITLLLPRTPSDIVLYLLIMLVIYYGRSSIEVTARVNDFVFPAFGFLLAALPLMLANELSFQRVEPMLGHGALPVIGSNFLTIGWFGDVIIAGCFLNTIRNAKVIYHSLRHAVVLSAALLSIILFMIISVLGSKIAGRILFNTYSLVEQIHITDFLDRMELLVFSVWIPAYILKTCFIFIAFMHGCTSFFQSRDHAPITRMSGWFLMLTTLLSFDSLSETFNFSNFGAIAIALVLHPLILVPLIIRAYRHKPKKKALEPPDEVHYGSRRKQPKQAGSLLRNMLHQRTLRSWRITSNALLGTAVALIIVGVLFGPMHSIVGTTCSLGFGFCLLFAVLTTHMERLTVVNEAFQRKMRRKKNKQSDGAA